ncbi:MAG: hypothetical protein IT336_00905 [Thermomicrobiales bacterium]|nr:hypothetical protein [Thermomicrobiales bacterium]
MAQNRGHGDLIQPDLVDQLIDFLAPVVHDILGRIDGETFTTVQFIELMQTDPDGKAAYVEALARWGEDENYSKMVVHGQVIPGILRRSELVEWAGYAHGEHDPYAVPAWWSMTTR